MHKTHNVLVHITADKITKTKISDTVLPTNIHEKKNVIYSPSVTFVLFEGLYHCTRNLLTVTLGLRKLCI